ncbi:hypothetical protein BH739_16380 [Enterococcus casseliflavus]|nr:hypothetical protein BH739_16380 [Enterococcus casseliflavus]
MRVTRMEQVNEMIFEKRTKLLGYQDFQSFKKDWNHLIFYAEGGTSSVVDAMRKDFKACPFECVSFDGWNIALLSR